MGFEIRVASDIFEEATNLHAGDEESSCSITPLQATPLSAIFLKYSIDNCESEQELAIEKEEILECVRKFTELNGVDFKNNLTLDLIERGQ